MITFNYLGLFDPLDINQVRLNHLSDVLTIVYSSKNILTSETHAKMCLVHTSHPPVDAFVVVVGVEKLNFLECFHTGEVAGDEGMHDQEEVERCRAW